MGDPGLLHDHGAGRFGPPRWLLPLLAAASVVLAGLVTMGVLRTPDREKCEAVGGFWERTSGGRYGSARCVMPDGAGTYD
jgi:hypothetical protein